MFNLDLKRAEVALEAGRLDDVFRLLRSSPQARHANGQQLIDRLIDALLDRGQQHFDRSWFREAHADAVRAQKLGGSQIKVVELLRKLSARNESMVMQVRPPMVSEQIEYERSPVIPGQRSLLQVDQLGSLLLLQGKVVTVGAVGARGCDIVLQTEGPREAIAISRDGEDYFANSRRAFLVNGISAKRHLLSDGDTIQVGSRGRLTFIRPVRASSSAVLQIKGSKMKRRDIRSVVLLDDAVIFGPGAAHFRLAGLKQRVVIRPDQSSSGDSFLVHQQGDLEPEMLDPEHSVSAGSVQFSLAADDATEPSERSPV